MYVCVYFYSIDPDRRREERSVGYHIWYVSTAKRAMTICCSSFFDITQNSLEFVPRKEYNVNGFGGILWNT